MSVINQKDYLKKYLKIGKQTKEKKKKKQSNKLLGKGLKIIDDDVYTNLSQEIQDDIDAANEDAPQIVAVIDDRPPSMRVDEKTKNNLWQPIGESNITSNESKNFKIGKINLHKNDEPKKSSKSKLHNNLPLIENKSKNLDDYSSKNRNEQTSRRKYNTSPPRDNNFFPPSRQGEDYSPQRRKDEDYSPPRRKDEDYSPSRRKDEDYSPPRRKNEDYSPPRRKDEDYSPPRRKDEDYSPPRRKDTNKDSASKRSGEDYSPLRRPDKNQSPLRKKYKDYSPSRRRDEDYSSPKKTDKDHSKSRRKNEDYSPSRRKDKDYSPQRRKDRDYSPKRRKDRKNSSAVEKGHSPERKKSKDSLLRKEKYSNDDECSLRKDSPPPTKTSGVKRKDDLPNPPIKKPSRWEKDDLSKPETTLSGKKSGLQRAQNLIEDMARLQKQEEEIFKTMSAEVSGVNAATVIRKKKQEEVRDPEKEAREKEMKEKYSVWGKGLKQVQDETAKYEDQLKEMNKPLARYADDEDLERYLKEQEREGDPMLAYIRKKKKKVAVEQGISEKPMYMGDFMPNRFGIPPGYRWDGVDRSNGYETKWFQTQNSKKAMQDEALMWSTEDM
ncbi:BUD13 homolog [Diorhabda carinulata]|uniref:BUD13 homolog n=1 Tax=Diorhabda carinulata TaxID=1163345 RepID=UPI0025A0C482|nr:BUD13 homolog [Diorhabda carinulata]